MKYHIDDLCEIVHGWIVYYVFDSSQQLKINTNGMIRTNH